jgi:hypothetical protein
MADQGGPPSFDIAEARIPVVPEREEFDRFREEVDRWLDDVERRIREFGQAIAAIEIPVVQREAPVNAERELRRGVEEHDRRRLADAAEEQTGLLRQILAAVSG